MQTLIFYPDTEPGFTRRRAGRGFSYRAPDGTRVADRAKRAELAAVAVPPAYEDVWITPRSNGHLLASGRDDRDRKQYIYHPAWRRLKDGEKFNGLADAAGGLPRLRSWIARNLVADPLSADAALAAALGLMDRMSLRLGDPAYTKANGSYGATTLRPDHYDPKSRLLSYTAKGGQAIEKRVRGDRLASVLAAFATRDGQTLLALDDGSGLSSARVNQIVADFCGEGASAKTLRTWNGTHAAFVAACRNADGPPPIAHLTAVAGERLHNSAAIARASYVHPSVLDHAADLPGHAIARGRGFWRRGERELVSFLQSTPAELPDVKLMQPR